MTFDLIDRTDTTQTPESDIGFGNALQKFFKQNQLSTQDFLQAPQTSSFINSQPFGSASSEFDLPSFTPLNNSDIEPIKTMEFKPFKPDLDGFNFLFNQPPQNQQPFSPIQTIEDRFPNNPSATPINKTFDDFLKNPNENLSFGQTPQTLLDTTGRLDKDLLNNSLESGLLKNLSFVPGQTNDESLNSLFEEPGSNRETDLEEAENPERVAGIGSELLKKIIGKKAIDKAFEKAKDLFKPSVKPKKRNKQEEVVKKPNLRKFDPKSKNVFENNTQDEATRDLNQAVDAIAQSRGIDKDSKEYLELRMELLIKWKKDDKHPKYTSIENPNPKSRENPLDFAKLPEGKHSFSSGVVRLPIGNEGFGKIKLQIKHSQEYKKLGFNSVEEYVSYVGEKYGEIYRDTKSGRIILVKKNGKTNNLVLELSPTEDKVYNVISGFPQSSEKFNERVKNGRFKLIGRREQNSGN